MATTSEASNQPDEQRAQLMERLKAEFFLPRLIENKYVIQQVIGEVS